MNRILIYGSLAIVMAMCANPLRADTRGIKGGLEDLGKEPDERPPTEQPRVYQPGVDAGDFGDINVNIGDDKPNFDLDPSDFDTPSTPGNPTTTAPGTPGTSGTSGGPATFTDRIRKQAERLRRQRELIKARQDQTKREEARKLRNRSERFNDRWKPIADKLDKDPDKVSAAEWRKMLGDAVKDHRADPTAKGPGTLKTPPPPPIASGPRKVFDEFGDEVPSDDPDYDHYLAEAKKRDEAKAKADAKANRPDDKSPTDVDLTKKGSSIDRLKDKLLRGKRPKGMSVEDWRRLTDEFMNDRADFMSERADTDRRIRTRHETENDNLAELLKKTIEELKRIEAIKDELSKEDLEYIERIMRERRRRLAKGMLKERKKLMDLLGDERAGKKSVREAWKHYGGLVGGWGAMTSRFNRAFRQLDTQGHGPASESVAGDPSDAAITNPEAPAPADPAAPGDPDARKPRPYDDGLPFPEWMGIDPKQPGGMRALALGRLHEARRNLDLLDMKLDKVADNVLSSDKARHRALANRLLHEDRLHDRVALKPAVDRRRAILKKARAKLDSDRPQRTETARREILKRMTYWKNEIAFQQKRLDDMAAAENQEKGG